MCASQRRSLASETSLASCHNLKSFKPFLLAASSSQSSSSWSLKMVERQRLPRSTEPFFEEVSRASFLPGDSSGFLRVSGFSKEDSELVSFCSEDFSEGDYPKVTTSFGALSASSSICSRSMSCWLGGLRWNFSSTV